MKFGSRRRLCRRTLTISSVRSWHCVRRKQNKFETLDQSERDVKAAEVRSNSGKLARQEMRTIINDFDAEGKRQCRAPLHSGATEVWTGITCLTISAVWVRRGWVVVVQLTPDVFVCRATARFVASDNVEPNQLAMACACVVMCTSSASFLYVKEEIVELVNLINSSGWRVPK